MKIFKDLYISLGEMLRRNSLLFVIILLLGLNQLFYRRVPGALLINLLLLGASLASFNFQDINRKRLVGLVLGFFLAGLYLLGLFTKNNFVQDSVFFLAYFIIALGFIGFSMKEEDFLTRFYLGLFQMATAGVYFLILYGVIYLISFLINQVLFLNLPYDGVVFRLANSLASMLGLFVLFSKKPEKASMSDFFEPLFKRILPKLSLIFGILSLIYHLQILLGFGENYPSLVFYLLMGLFFLFYLLSYWQEEPSREKDFILLLFILLSLSHLLIVVNASGRVDSYSRGRGIYHELLAGLAFMIYAGRFLRDKSRISSIKWLLVFLAALLSLPPLGYGLYESYDYKDLSSRTTSLWEDFSIEKEAPRAEGDGVYFYYPKEELGLIALEDYSYMQELNFYTKEESYFSFEDLEIEALDGGKTLEVRRGKRTESFDILAEARDREEGKYQLEEPLIYEVLDTKIYIFSYSYGRDYYDIFFMVLIR